MALSTEGESVTLRTIAGFTHCSQIASYRNGRFSASLENLNAALGSVDSSKFSEDIPIAVIGITGGTGMGKGFLITCLLNYLENGEMGWMKTALGNNDKSRDVVEFRFTQSYVATQAILDHGEKSETRGGIYLWPEPILVKNDKGRPILAWIMEVEPLELEGADSSELEEFLSVVCSIIMELELNNDSFQIKILEPSPAISSPQDSQYPEPVSVEKICDTTVHMFRCDTENAPGDALRLLLNPNGTVNTKLLRNMRKVFNNVVQSIMEAHLDNNERGMDKVEVLEMKLGNMHTFITTAVENANEHRKQREKAYSVVEETSKIVVPQIQQIFPHFVELWIKNHLNLSTLMQIQTLHTALIKEMAERYRGTISPILWKEFMARLEDKCESSCQKTLKNLSDAISRLCHLLNQQFEFHSYVPLEKLKQIASEELTRQKNEMQDLGLKLFRRTAYEKLVDIYNKKNGTVLKNELGHFVNDVNKELGQVYTNVVEQYLKKATYHPLLFESLRVKIVEKVREEIKNTFGTSINAGNVGNPPQVFPQDDQRGFSFDTPLGAGNSSMLENRMLTLLNMSVRDNPEEYVSWEKPFGSIMQELLNVYHGEMKELLKGAQISSQKLQNNHSQLAEKLLDIFERACKQSNMSIVDKDICSEKIKLGESLNNAFVSHYSHTQDTDVANGLAIVRDRQDTVEPINGEDVKVLLNQVEKALKEKQEIEKAVRQAKAEMIIKQKEETERHQQEEQASLAMEQCFTTGVSQMETMFPSAIDYWVNNHLTISSINKMETIYTSTLHGITEEHRGAVHPKLWKEFVSRLDGHCKDECIKTLKDTGDPLLKINSTFKRQFILHGYLSASKLEQIAAEAFGKETNNIDPGLIRDMIALATERLLNIYQQHNLLIVETEKDVVKSAMTQVMEVYREQMNRYWKAAPYSPQKLQKIHSALVEKLCEAFKNACHLSSSAGEAIAVEENSMKDNLEQEFSSYKQANHNKLMKLLHVRKEIIKGIKNMYNEKIVSVLNRNPDGLDMKTLTKNHTSIQIEVMKLLEMEIRTKIRSNEPVENHENLLLNHIDGYWLTVVEANRKNLKKAQEKAEREERERKKREAQRQLEELQREAERRRSRLGNERRGRW